MKIYRSLVILSFSALFLPMCKPAQAYDKYIKELDSLKIVVEQAVDNFNTVDSAGCYDAYSKQYTYSAFLGTHLKDTVSKETAEGLQSFFAAGKPMSEYLAMRPVWLSDARVEIRQLSLLTNDLKTGSLETDEAIDFINDEKQKSQKIIEELKANTSLIRKYLESYTNTLPIAQSALKNINLGKLPETIKPEIKRN